MGLVCFQQNLHLANIVPNDCVGFAFGGKFRSELPGMPRCSAHSRNLPTVKQENSNVALAQFIADCDKIKLGHASRKATMFVSFFPGYRKYRLI
jgi:hypothetical protein